MVLASVGPESTEVVFVIFVSAYSCMHICLCIYIFVGETHVYICVHGCGGSRLVLDVFLYHFLPDFLRQSLSLGLELDKSAKLTG